MSRFGRIYVTEIKKIENCFAKTRCGDCDKLMVKGDRRMMVAGWSRKWICKTCALKTLAEVQLWLNGTVNKLGCENFKDLCTMFAITEDEKIFETSADSKEVPPS